ncbi:MAG: DUF4340 domain-containing protein [Peptococcaceae bacterium]
MKRTKRIYFLLGFLAVICLATFGILQLEDQKEQIQNSDSVILEIASDSVQALSWEYRSESLSFHKTDSWHYDADSNFPVDADKINSILEQFQSFGVSFLIENVENYGQYGLEHPVCTIRLETEEQSYEIRLGNYSSMDAERYVSIGDGNVYLVKNDPLYALSTDLSDFIDHDETPDFDQMTELQFTGTEHYRITYDENSDSSYRADDVYFTTRNGKTVPLDTTRVNNYLNSLRYLNLTNYVTYHVSDDALQQYGLDDPELTVTMDYSWEDENGETQADTFILHISRDPEEQQAAAEKEEDDDESDSDTDETITAYARVDQSDIIYQLTSYDYKELMDASYDSLRHREVIPADFADIEQIDIALDDSTYTITSEKKKKERIWYYQEEELEIKNLQNALEDLKADSFTTEQPSQKKEISLTLSLDREGNPKIQVDLYRYDGSHCLAVVDGKPVSLIKRTSVVDLVEAVHAIVLN